MFKAEDIMQEAIDLKLKKSKDYQGSKWSEADYFPFKDESYMHMIHTKYSIIKLHYTINDPKSQAFICRCHPSTLTQSRLF